MKAKKASGCDTLKTVKELKRGVKNRLACCWGENTAIFFITVGGLSAAVMAWATTVDFLSAADFMMSPSRRIDLTDGLTAAVTAAALLILWGIAEPFRYGVKWYRLQQVRGNSVHAGSIFSCYGSWKRSGQVFKLDAALFVRQLYFTLPMMAALAAGIFLLNRIGSKGNSTAYSIAAAAVFLLFACIICAAVVLNCRYAAAPYLFALEPDTPPKKLIEKSIELTRGKTAYLADAMFSAAGWLVPCIFIFPMIFVLPYMRMIYTAAINEVIGDGSAEGKRGENLAEQYSQN